MAQVSSQADDLDSITDEDLAAWCEKLQQAAEIANREGVEGWHNEPHVAERAPLSRVREELRRAGYTANKVRDDLARTFGEDNVGSQEHNDWHLANPGKTHGL